MGEYIWTQEKSLKAGEMKIAGKSWKAIAKEVGLYTGTVIKYMRIEPERDQEKSLYKMRNFKQCLQCEGWFFSLGKYNRRCPRCRELGEAATMLTLSRGELGYKRKKSS